MNIESVRATVKAIPKEAKGLIDKVGAKSIDYVGSFTDKSKKFATDKVKSDEFKFISKRVADFKDSVTGSKAYKNVSSNKETYVGSAVILAAVGCIAAIIKAISNSKNNFHRG